MVDSYIRKPGDILRNRRRWTDPETSDLPVAFILGPPRSGTTLLNRVLLNHSAIRGFPVQTNIFSPRSIYDLKRFSHYADPSITARALTETRSLSGFFARLHELSFPDLPQDGYYLEKTPQHARYLSHILRHLPKSKVIFAVRDARDTFCSGRSAQNIPQVRSVPVHARYFNSCVDPVRGLLSNHERILVVRYEEFTAAPEAGLTRIMGFLGLDPEMENQLAPSNEAKDWRAAEKAFERLNQPITPATVGRWRNEMSTEEMAAYRRIAGKSLELFGYPLT
jgi:hypothetical protein